MIGKFYSGLTIKMFNAIFNKSKAIQFKNNQLILDYLVNTISLGLKMNF